MAVTIYDLAKEAGCAISTVSKALNGSLTISEETKRRVADAAERLGYRPNARARSFARQKSGTVIFATELYQNIAFENPHMFEILTGISRSLEKKGYSVVIKHIEKSQAAAYIRDLMLEKLADGIILHAAILTRELAAFLSHADTPYLVIGKPNFSCNVCWVDVNHELAGHVAASYLLDKGYRHILFHAGSLTDDISRSRLEGLRQAMAEEDLVIDTIFTDSPYKENAEALREKLLEPDRPEVIHCETTRIALGCLHCLQQMSIRIPEQVALMTFDHYPFASLLRPAITAVEVDMFDMGWEAARYLLQRIKKPNLQTQVFCTTPTLVEREST